MSDLLSLKEMALKLKITPDTLRQLCDTDQVYEGAYVVLDKGTVWEHKRFDEGKTIKALKGFLKAQPKAEPEVTPEDVEAEKEEREVAEEAFPPGEKPKKKRI